MSTVQGNSSEQEKTPTQKEESLVVNVVTEKVNLAKPNDSVEVSLPETPSQEQIKSDTIKTSASIAEERISALHQQDQNIILTFNQQQSTSNMTTEQPIDTGSHFQAKASTIGGVLKFKREEKQLSIEDIATRIRLSIKQVTALEQDDLANLPQITFVRGFVRNYARALGLDGDDLLRKYPYPMQEDHQAQVLSKESTNIRINTHQRSFLTKKPMIIAIIILVGSLVTYEIFRDKGGQVSPQNVLSNIQKSLNIDPNKAKNNNQQISVDNLNKPTSSSQQTMITTIQQPTIAEAPQPVPIQKPVFSKDKSEIQLDFKGSSWVQVRDRDDKVLFSQVGNEGSSEKIVGKAPFIVLVGNTPNIKITYNNNAVDLSQYSGAKVAKLKLN